MKMLKSRRKAASYLTKPVEALQRIESRLKIDANGCHLYEGSRTYSGYGQISLEGLTWAVHRVRYELLNGDVPAPDKTSGKRGYMVLHHCDVPACCNPEHLYVGTAADNAKDMADRRRMRPGYRPHSYMTSRSQGDRPVGTVFYEYMGEVKRLDEWASILGLNSCTLDRRFRAGWPEKDIPKQPDLGFKNWHRGQVSYRRFSGVREVEQFLQQKRKRSNGGNRSNAESENLLAKEN